MALYAWIDRARGIAVEGESLRSAGHLEAARTRFATAVRMLERSALQGQEESSQAAAIAHLGLGRTYLGLDLPERALQEFTTSQELQPARWEAFYWAGCAQGWLADYREAEQSLSTALRLEPQAGRAHLQRGYARFRRADLDGALADLLEADAQGSLDDRGRITLAAVHLQRREGAAAERVLRAVDPSGSDPTAAFLLASAIEQQGYPDQAVHLYHRALPGIDTKAAACGRLGLIQLRRADLEGAYRWLEGAVTAGNADDVVLFHHAWVACQLKRFDRCAQSWTALRKRHPPQRLVPLVAQANRALGGGFAAARAQAALHMWRGQWQEAVSALEALAAGDAWRTSMLPHCLYHAGLLDELIRSRSTDPVLRFWQGLAHASTGRADHAVRALRYVLQRRPGDELARRALGLIQLQMAFRLADQGDWEAAATTLATASGASAPVPGARLAEMLVFLLAGRRDDAVRVLERAFRQEPTDPPTVHNLALLRFHGGVPGRDGGSTDGHDWARASIGVWSALLRNAAVWERWQAGARKRYGVAVAPSAIVRLQADVEARFRVILDRVGATGREVADDLPMLFEHELSAALSLANAGGLGIAGATPRRLACGPLLVRDLALEPVLGSLAASSWLMEDTLGGEPARSRAARLFSPLGPAQAYLDAEQPRTALAALTMLRCPRCTPPRGRPATQVLWRPAVCVETCPEFDRRNPAYSGLQNKGRRLLDEAASLTIDIRLSLAGSEIATLPMNLDSAIQQWREASYLAGELGRHQDTQRRITAAALGRSKAMERRGNHDEAITLLERVVVVTGPSRRRRLEGRLAELLADRGIRAANEHPARRQASVADLRRSVEQNPHAPRPVRNFVIALRMLADELLEQGRLHDASDLLSEAVQLRNGAAGSRDDPQLQEQLERAEHELDMLLAAPYRPWTAEDGPEGPP
jgi:tetratricopeptide (TPR) repeat protein